MAKGTVNKVILMGRLGQDPDIRYAASGAAVAKFSVATTEREKKGDQWEDRTEWHRVVCFGNTAENAGKYLSKGSSVFLEGALRTNQWEKDGVKHYSTEIVVRDMQFVGGKPDGAQSGSSRSNRTESTGGHQGTNQPSNDDEIPF